MTLCGRLNAPALNFPGRRRHLRHRRVSHAYASLENGPKSTPVNPQPALVTTAAHEQRAQEASTSSSDTGTGDAPVYKRRPRSALPALLAHAAATARFVATAAAVCRRSLSFAPGSPFPSAQVQGKEPQALQRAVQGAQRAAAAGAPVAARRPAPPRSRADAAPCLRADPAPPPRRSTTRRSTRATSSTSCPAAPPPRAPTDPSPSGRSSRRSTRGPARWPSTAPWATAATPRSSCAGCSRAAASSPSTSTRSSSPRPRRGCGGCSPRRRPGPPKPPWCAQTATTRAPPGWSSRRSPRRAPAVLLPFPRNQEW